MLKVTPFVKGMATFIPGVYPLFRALGLTGTQSPNSIRSASYHYTVWLRHLILASENGLPKNPRVVAELGPGSSLGSGLAALLTGAERYYALDIVRHANVARNLRVFDELIDLLHSRADIPGDEQFPGVYPKLASYRFPHQLLDRKRLGHALEPARLARIRRSVAHPTQGDSYVRYIVPWYDVTAIEAGSVDMLFSQAVLEHVDKVAIIYDQMYQWLKPAGGGGVA